METSSLLRTLSLVLAAACGGGEGQPKDAGIDASGPPDASCFEDPQTHEQIINACTTAQKVIKKPTLPLLNADGSLPALPP